MLFWFHPDPDQASLWKIPRLDEYPTDDWVPLEPEWTVRCPWRELAENGPDYVHIRDADGPIMQFRRWAARFHVGGDPVAARRTGGHT